jgi:HEAT repeat protein
MDVKAENSREIFELLTSGESEKVTELLYNLSFDEVDSEVIKSIVPLILQGDKSIKNATSNFLIQSNHSTIPSLVIEYISSEDISIRNLAGEILLKKGTDSIKAICEKLPNITNDDDIKFLVDILGLIGDKYPEDLIIDILSKNENENVIVACIEALGNIYSEKAIDSIIPFYEKSEILKPVVIEATGKISTLKSLQFITEKFKTDDDLLRFTMIESLGEIGDEETFYFLLSQIENLGGALIWPLLEAIYKLKVKYDLEVPFDDKIKKCVLDTIINAEPRYQIVAAHLVTVFDDPEILFACLSIYGIDMELNELLYGKFMENKNVIISRLYNVIDSSNKHLVSVLELLTSMIQDEQLVLKELSVLDKRRLTESLSNSLTNPDEVVRILAAELLFMIDTETALLFVDTMIADENFWNRMRLLDILSEIEHPLAMESIERLVSDPEEMVREKSKEIALRKQYLIN